MPYPISHLKIAWEIINRRKNTAEQIEHPEAFLLGSIAPDAVHFAITNSNIEVYALKKISHIVMSDEAWGQVTDNDRWLGDLIGFYNRHLRAGDVEPDFLRGYYCHILADMYNNKNVWLPYLKLHPELQNNMIDGQRSTIHNARGTIDKLMYHSWQDKETVWVLLKSATVCRIQDAVVSETIDILRADELERIRTHVLYEQYKDIGTVANTYAKATEKPSSPDGEIYTVSDEESFVWDAVGYVESILLCQGD